MFLNQAECVVLHDRKLNIAPAIKKQTVVAPNGAMYYTGNPAIPLNSIPVDQFAAIYPSPGLPAIYPPAGMPYQQFYPYYSLPMVSHLFFLNIFKIFHTHTQICSHSSLIIKLCKVLCERKNGFRCTFKEVTQFDFFYHGQL